MIWAVLLIFSIMFSTVYPACQPGVATITIKTDKEYAGGDAANDQLKDITTKIGKIKIVGFTGISVRANPPVFNDTNSGLATLKIESIDDCNRLKMVMMVVKYSALKHEDTAQTWNVTGINMSRSSCQESMIKVGFHIVKS